jgi:hypothetical protein
MPTNDEMQSIPEEIFKNICKRAIGTTKSCEQVFSGRFAQTLTKEMNLDFMRALNKLQYDKEVILQLTRRPILQIDYLMPIFNYQRLLKSNSIKSN